MARRALSMATLGACLLASLRPPPACADCRRLFRRGDPNQDNQVDHSGGTDTLGLGAWGAPRTGPAAEHALGKARWLEGS